MLKLCSVLLCHDTLALAQCPVDVLVPRQHNVLVTLYFDLSDISNSSQAHVRRDSISAMTG